LKIVERFPARLAAVAKLRRELLMLGAPIFQNFNGFLDASVNSVRVQGPAAFGVTRDVTTFS